MLGGERLALFDELRSTHGVDHGDRSAGIGRKTPAKDRAHIGIARIGDDAFLEAARSFQGLYGQKPLSQLIDLGVTAPFALAVVEQAGP